jgi:hypothetical protein
VLLASSWVSSTETCYIPPYGHLFHAEEKKNCQWMQNILKRKSLRKCLTHFVRVTIN